ncbi:hypothetical protein HK097_005046, partial [Rhizophlyctis rosea]
RQFPYGGSLVTVSSSNQHHILISNNIPRNNNTNIRSITTPLNITITAAVAPHVHYHLPMMQTYRTQ